MAELSDAEVFGTAPAPPKEMSDAEVFGASGPGITGYGIEALKQAGIGLGQYAGTAIQALAPKDVESRRLESAISGVMEGGMEPAEAMQMAPVPALPLTEEPLYKAGEKVQTGVEKFLQPKGILPPLGQEVARAFGTVGGAILSGFIPGGAATIPLQGIGEAAQTAVQKGATPEQSERAAQLGTIAGMTDFVDLLLPSLGGSTGKALGLIGRVGLRALEGVFVEGGQEGLQQWIQNKITQGVYKPDQDQWEDVPRSALVGAIVGGGTSAVIGGHAHPPETIPPSQGDLGEAGTGIVQPPTPPTTPPIGPQYVKNPTTGQLEVIIPPELGAAAAGVQGELPLGPPITLTPGQMGASTTAIKDYVANLKDNTNNAEPSINPLVQRGHAVGGVVRAEALPTDVLETNPQNVAIPQESIDRIPERVRGEKVAVPAIEYNGMLFPGSLHLEAVGNAMQKLGLTENQVIDSPGFKEGFVTTEGRFVSREEAAHIAARHDQFQSLAGEDLGSRLFADNLKTFEDPTQYIKPFEAITKSQQARGLRGEAIPEAVKQKFTPKGPVGTALSTKFGQVIQGQNVNVPPRSGGRKAFTFKSVHSTNVGNFLPNLTFTHLKGEPVAHELATALVQKLTSIIPELPIHFGMRTDVNRVSPGADGVYLAHEQDLAKPVVEQGPIFIPADLLLSKNRLTEVILHETTHGATANVIKKDPIIRGKIRTLMDETARHIPNFPKTQKELEAAIKKGDIAYGFLNEREWITEAFNNPEFQSFLLAKGLPQKIARQLGLEGKPSIFKGFVDTVLQALGLVKSPRMMSLLEATIRVGGETIDEQMRQMREMQAKFNSVEPALQAVPRQDETRGIYDALRGLKDHIDPEYSAELVRQAGYADKMNWFYKYNIHAFQLGELNPRLAELQRLLEKFRFAATDEASINDMRIKVTKDWVNLGRNMSERMVGLIDDITNMVYRTQKEIQQGIGRKPTQAEFNTLVRKHGVNAAALQVMQKINKAFDMFLDKSAELARLEAMKITDLAERAKAIAIVNQNIANLKSRPYFPFMRYGRHVVTVQNQAGRVIHREHFESRGFKTAAAMQKDAMARLERAFPAPMYTVKPDILSESSGPMVGMPGVMLDMMAQKLNLSPSQLKALDQLKFEVSPAQSFRHRFQNKSYTAGYSKDFRRSFAQYFFHGAKWYVKTKYADGMRADIKAIRDNALSSLTPIKRIEIANFLDRHLKEGFLNPVQDFTTLKAGLVFYTLSFVPVSAAVNMSQVPMQTLPHLAGKFGNIQASKALLKSMATWKNYYKKDNLASMTSDEARALNYAIRTQRLEQTLGSELAAWGQGGNLMGFEGNSLAQVLHSMVEKGMWIFSMAEKWNRRVTFSATRELALAQPNNAYVKEVLTRYVDELKNMIAEGFSQAEAEAILVATHAVDQTQGMTGQMAKPQIMRGKYGTLFLYKRYVQNLLFWSFNNKRDVMPKFIVMALLMAGLHGLPGYDDLAEIARVLGYRLFGKDFSVDREVRKLMRALGADEYVAADQVLHGSARLGFGVPWLLNMMGNAVGQSPTVNQKTGQPSGLDLSAAIAPGTILPVELGKLLGPPITSPAEAFAAQSARAGGVMGQLAYNFYQAIASKDDLASFKRWELAMPRAAKLLTQAYRAYSTEKVSGKNDTALIQFDTRDPEHLGEILGMAGGARPRRLTAKWEELRDQNDQIKFIDVNRGILLDQWAAAVRSQDPRERENMRIATQQFNAELPTWARGFALKSETIQQSVGMRLKTQVTQEAGFAIQRGRIPLIQEIQSLHPESVVDVRKVR